MGYILRRQQDGRSRWTPATQSNSRGLVAFPGRFPMKGGICSLAVGQFGKPGEIMTVVWCLGEFTVLELKRIGETKFAQLPTYPERYLLRYASWEIIEKIWHYPF